MTPLAIAIGAGFVLLGAAAERLAAVWPPDEASRRPLGARTALLAVAAGAAGWGIAARSTLPAWATAAHLGILALLVLLSATDLEQRRLPHLLLDPLIVAALAFVPFNPSVAPLDALIGAVVAVAFLGVLNLLIRGGVAMGDLYLVAPLGLLLGWQAVFGAIFLAALLSAAASLVLLVTGRAGLKSYIPFGPFLVAGTVLTLLRDERLLGEAAALLRTAVAAVDALARSL
ncbi:MAG TPA: A24 family peptidase [candidate division Zixibacteria bacterium]|nr:A24 family peptidase [candidate division Zixibacteria bacterium]